MSAGAIATEAEAASAFGGTTYTRTGTFTRPTAGTARYHGGYAGIIDNNLATGIDRGLRTSGDAFIRVNFNEGVEGHLEGWVENRQIIDTGALLDRIELKDTALTNGEFFGDVIIGTTDVGDYGGVLGGAGATEIASVLVFNPFGTDAITEYGVFILPECSTANASPNCP
ncbi:MAG: hypothetical protein L3J30_05365 [Marinosulfonomonas sp.]|nr:hypothetical protein [Marinosulfonomonas sp.]